MEKKGKKKEGEQKKREKKKKPSCVVFRMDWER